MISYDFVPISSQKGVLFFETPGIVAYFNFLVLIILVQLRTFYPCLLLY